MIAIYSLLVVALSALLAACGKAPSPNATNADAEGAHAATPAALGTQVVLPTDDYLELPQFRDADRERGERLVMQCRACHSFDKNGRNIIGPNLHGFFGRRVASVAGYSYSPALRNANFIWTPQALDAWLAQPADFLPGNWMVYGGLKSPEDRNAAVAALLRLTADEPEVPRH
jgi:cytochrome c